jgi:hypothetical protein
VDYEILLMHTQKRASPLAHEGGNAEEGREGRGGEGGEGREGRGAGWRREEECLSVCVDCVSVCDDGPGAIQNYY